MAFTQSDLDRIDQALASGTLSSMTFGEQTYTFRSVDDLLKLRAVIARAIAAGASPGPSGTRYGATSKGV